ncbi:glycosyltransferase family 4 protein [Seonamhaeicola maritimus]|uniref:glycosyltransferase family 4 protein n=1 Tax=Seonamhaeicola maritimus TaxID=2591822 RepID=UPI002493E8EA|nr:glycosyltransferase family 4 protein [Seonamhaeicola maritimus]
MSDLIGHIGIVTSEFPPQPGGIGNHAYNLAKQLKQHDFEVSVIADARSTTGAEETLFDKTLPFEVHRVWVKNVRLFIYLKRFVLLSRVLRHHDLVIASGKFSLWSVGFFSLFYKRRYIAVVHGTEVNFQSFLLRFLVDLALTRFSKIIAVSSYTKSLLKSKFQQKTTVIPNGFDFANWQRHDEPTSPIKGSPRLITVGNVTERKGQLQVIRHLPKLIETYPDCHYHCVGIPTNKDLYLQEAYALGVQNHVTFHGKVAQEDLVGLVQASDIFVMLSTETETGDVEGFGIAIIEANALGIPAIGTRGSGIVDAILDGQSGLLIDGGNGGAFVDGVKTILNDRTEFSKRASKWADKHRWEYIIRQYVNVIVEGY